MMEPVAEKDLETLIHSPPAEYVLSFVLIGKEDSTSDLAVPHVPLERSLSR